MLAVGYYNFYDRPRRRWFDEVKGCLSDKGLTIPEAKECVKERREWRRIVEGRRR